MNTNEVFQNFFMHSLFEGLTLWLLNCCQGRYVPIDPLLLGSASFGPIRKLRPGHMRTYSSNCPDRAWVLVCNAYAYAYAYAGFTWNHQSRLLTYQRPISHP